MKLLDLFCGAGGAAEGYYQAGFTNIVGVDTVPQPNYPFHFIQADALEFNTDGFDMIHASPPCQAYSTASGRAHKQGKEHVDLMEPTRQLLKQSGTPYVIENVVGAPLHDPIQLCGSSFGLDVRRHRLFECSFDVPPIACAHAWQTPRFRSLDSRMVKAGKLASVVGVHGNCNYAGEGEIRADAMGIYWMSQYELTQAIPPLYTQYIGQYFRIYKLRDERVTVSG